PPILLVGSSIVYPRVFSKQIRSRLKFAFMDLRIFLPQDPGIAADAVTMDTLLRDVNQVREHLQLSRFAIIGHSTLGLLALEYARRWPEHVSHVVMIGTPPVNVIRYGEVTPEVKAFWESTASQERKELLAQNESGLTERMQAAAAGQAFGVWYAAHAPMYFFD